MLPLLLKLDPGFNLIILLLLLLLLLLLVDEVASMLDADSAITDEELLAQDTTWLSIAALDDPGVVKYFFDNNVSNNESTKVCVFVSRNTSKSLMQRSRDG